MTSKTNAWITLPNSWTCELVAQVGFDYMTIDAQHGFAKDFSVILPMLQASSAYKSKVLVRMPSNEHAFATNILDAGATGLICPLLKTAEETEQFVQSCLYPPKGNRSYGPLRAGKLHANYFENANNLAETWAMIETKEAVENIEAFASIKELTGFYVGPWDLSLAMGFNTMADFSNPELLAIFDKVLEVAHRNSKMVALHCSNPQDGIAMAKRGFDVLTIFNDSRGLQNAGKSALNAFKK